MKDIAEQEIIEIGDLDVEAFNEFAHDLEDGPTVVRLHFAPAFAFERALDPAFAFLACFGVSAPRSPLP